MRKYRDAREDNYRTSWQTRILAQYIAGGYMVAKGESNEALQKAGQLAYDDVEQALLEEPEEQPVAENGVGSFERFMLLMGNGGQRPV